MLRDGRLFCPTILSLDAAAAAQAKQFDDASRAKIQTKYVAAIVGVVNAVHPTHAT